MQRVGQDWVVFTHLTDHSATVLGVTTVMQFAPYILISPYAGLLADRLPRRRLLLITQSTMGTLALILGVLTLTGWVQLWHVYTLAFALGCASAVDGPVRQTFVGEMVPPDLLSNAVGLNSASFNGARLIGPGISGLLIAAIGAGWVFIVNGATFAATIIGLLAMRFNELRPLESAPRSKGQLREALRYVRSRQDILLILIVMGVVSTFGMNFQVTSALMSTVVFGLGPGEFGLVGSVLAVGSLAGALIAARRRKPSLTLIVGAGFGFALAAGINAVMPNYATFVATTPLVGLSALTMMTAANATIQMSTEPKMRGRVMALYMMIFLGVSSLGSPLVGWIGDVFNPRWAIGVGALATLAVCIAACVFAAKAWGVQAKAIRRWPYVEIIHDPHMSDASSGSADRSAGD